MNTTERPAPEHLVPDSVLQTLFLALVYVPRALVNMGDPRIDTEAIEAAWHWLEEHNPHDVMNGMDN